MEQKMDPGEGLSIRQKQFLDVVLEQTIILQNFYLTGGTALASWYLHHRESYDLDFFSEEPFDGDKITMWIKQQQEKLDFQNVSVNDDFGFYTFFFRYPDNSRLKVDFCHYPVARIVSGVHWEALAIDSMYDIAVNKVHTLRTNPRERDYVDLYMILEKTHWKLEKLLQDADKKFTIVIDSLNLAKNFLKANEITDYPKMLVPFKKKDMVDFYEGLAGQLKPKILK